MNENPETAIGQPIVLLTDGKQHSTELWAKVTADMIFDTDDLTDERLITAAMTKAKIEAALRGYFDDAILFERRELSIWPKHCGTDLNPVPFAAAAMMAVQTIYSPEWGDVLKSLEWSEPALHVIGTVLASAMHIERLNYADECPEDETAQNYKLKSQQGV